MLRDWFCFYIVNLIVLRFRNIHRGAALGDFGDEGGVFLVRGVRFVRLKRGFVPDGDLQHRVEVALAHDLIFIKLQ